MKKLSLRGTNMYKSTLRKSDRPQFDLAHGTLKYTHLTLYVHIQVSALHISYGRFELCSRSAWEVSTSHHTETIWRPIKDGQSC